MKNTIAFETLQSLDIRMCLVESVSEIRQNAKKPPGDDNPVKAYHLIINTGAEQRECVTNLVDRPPEALLNKTFPFILNLPEAKIRGVLSKAMIVAATAPDGKVALLTSEAPAGSVVF